MAFVVPTLRGSLHSLLLYYFHNQQLALFNPRMALGGPPVGGNRQSEQRSLTLGVVALSVTWHTFSF